MNGFWWFLIGFATATGLAIWWYRGTGKQWLDSRKKAVEDRIKL